MLYYIYNDVDNLIGFKYNNDLYYYQRNAQEDIIGILDSSYNVVAKYEYDSWGSITSIIDVLGNDISGNLSHIGNINPFRYRSYYYDTETSLYYLNSRYYNAIWGRFLNADGIIGANRDIISSNLYAYVSNNYINMSDENGEGIFSKIVNFVSSIYDYSINKSTPKGAPKPKKPISSTAKSKEKLVNKTIINEIANSKISYSVGLSGGYGITSGTVTYGNTIAPNAEINKNNLTLSGELSLSMGPKFYPIASFSFQPNYTGGYTTSKSGFSSPYISFGAGINYSTSEIYGITLSPTLGTNVGTSYIWEWDSK